MKDTAKTALEFASRCLTLFRLFPQNNMYLHLFWQEYCHNLPCLIQDCENNNTQALDWYIGNLNNCGFRPMANKAIKDKHYEQSKKELNTIITQYFHYDITEYLTNLKQAIKEGNAYIATEDKLEQKKNREGARK